MGLLTISTDQLINGVASRLIYEGSICASWPCWNEGSCLPTSSDRNYTCQCTAAYAGRHCEIKVADVCSSSACTPGSSCSVDGLTINCPRIIKDLVSSCLTTPCLHDGVCVDSSSGHRCRCPAPFHGPFCQFDSTEWGYHWTVIEVSLFLLVIFLVLCAIAMICCSYTNSMGVYVSVPNKRYQRWEEGEVDADSDDEDDVIALGEIKKSSLRLSHTRETILDNEPGCSNPCLGAAAPAII